MCIRDSRYKDGWTLEYVAALLAKWESSQASVDQQGRITYKARRQAPASVSAVQQPRASARPPPAAAPATATAPRQSSGPTSSTPAPAKPCYRCGGPHPKSQCPYISHTCEKCNTLGHPGFHCQRGNRNRGVAAAVQQSVLPSSFADTVQGAPTPRTQV